MSRYLGYFRNSFVTGMAYRGDFWLRVLVTALAVSIQYYLWHAIYQSKAGPIAGYGMQEAITYVVIAASLASFLQTELSITRRMRDGSIATTLARPINWQVMVLSETAGTSLFTLVAVSFPVYLGALYFGIINPPSSPLHAAAFVISLGLGFLVLFGWAYVLQILSFWTKAGFGLIDIQATFVAFFSGALVPLAMYPGWLRSMAAVLPFQGIYSLPLTIYLGKVGPYGILPALAGQAGWALALALAGRMLWRKAMAELTVNGG